MITLVLGGARSGKSACAERRAAAAGPDVTYVATGVELPDDPEFTERVRRHRDRRPPSWATVEIPFGGDLTSVLRATGGTVLLDSLGTWLAGIRDFSVDGEDVTGALTERSRDGHRTIVVSDETGLGVHPETATGREFRDALGDLNAAIAAVADDVLLVVAGRVLELGPDPVAEAAPGSPS